jgi:HD-GYP domain-containing protein (c-di-GMP phosphodiesterase class II)
MGASDGPDNNSEMVKGRSWASLRSIGPALGLFGLLLALPLVLLLVLRSTPQLDPLFQSVNFHIVAVSAIAACAMQVAVLAAIAAARTRRAAPVLLALGCVMVGTFMLGHGLTTPGVGGRPFSMWVARFPVLAIAGFAVFLAAATGKENSRIFRSVARHPALWLLLPTASVVAFCAAIVAAPLLASGAAPFPGEPDVRQTVVIGAAVLLLITGWVHWRRWRLGQDRVELALVLASWLSVDALASLELAELWRLSWWDYHAFLLIGFAAAAYAVVAASRRTRSIESALTSISLRDPLEHIVHGYPEALHALVGAVEAKDRYTHGHSSRVAELSHRIGLVLSLGPDRLRGLTQGGLLHDIGKIGVPDHILNKPGALTPEEREWIEQHPMAGWEMAVRVPSLREALAVVRHHHERWDGAGYPDRLAGEGIALAARVAAVADVWDALTSDRAYRPAWPEDKALALIVGERGQQFDPLCVDAFLQVLAEREQTREPAGDNTQHLPA